MPKRMAGAFSAPIHKPSGGRRKTREWLNTEKVIQKEDKGSICGRGDEESRRVKEEYFEDDGNTDKYCWPW